MNIFYSDMWMISGKGCLIMGSGKSRCCRPISDQEVGQDSICLTRVNNEIFGHFEPTIFPVQIEPNPKKIDYIVRCLSEEETENYFNQKKLECHFVKYEEIFNLCLFNITFVTNFASQFLGDTFDEYADPKERIKRFYNLTSDIKDIKCIIIPWMPSLEEKSQIFKSFIKDNNSRISPSST